MIFLVRHLKKLPRERAWEIKEVRALVKMVRKGRDLRYIAQKLNRTEWAVNEKINEWRIYK
jgi:hypothetical protein